MAENVKITTLAQLKVALEAAKAYIDGEIGGLGGGSQVRARSHMTIWLLHLRT